MNNLGMKDLKLAMCRCELVQPCMDEALPVFSGVAFVFSGVAFELGLKSLTGAIVGRPLLGMKGFRFEGLLEIL